jgi:hypothetical protein
MDDEIAGEVRVPNGLLGMGRERAIRDTQVMVVDEFFALEMQLRHMRPL